MMPFALLFFSVLLESFSTFPFVLILLVFLSIHLPKSNVLFLAFLGGILLDILLFRSLGISSIFLVVFTFLTLSYQNKFEADTTAFVGLFSFVGSFLYLLLTSQEYPLFISIVSAALSSLIYFIYKNRLGGKRKKW
jgi:rod shape-determining protein MreD